MKLAILELETRIAEYTADRTALQETLAGLPQDHPDYLPTAAAIHTVEVARQELRGELAHREWLTDPRLPGSPYDRRAQRQEVHAC